MKVGYFRRIRFPLIVILGLLGLCGSLFYFAPAPLQPGSESEIADTADTHVQKSVTDSPLSTTDIDKNGVWQWIDLGIDLGHRPARLIAGSENRWYIEIDHPDALYRIAANRILYASSENDDTVQSGIPQTAHTRTVAGKFTVIEWKDYSLENYAVMVNWISNHPMVDSWSPDYVRKAAKRPNDPEYPGTLGLLNDQLDLNIVWRKRTDASPVIIALLDSGMNYQHEELRENTWINEGEALNGQDDTGNGYVDDIHGWDFVDNDAEPFEEFDHGTKLGLIIGAKGNNNIGGTGIAWKCRIMPIRVLGSDGYGSDSDIIDGIHYGIDNGARIFNMSFGGAGYSQYFENAMQDIAENNGTAVISAGNDGRDIDNEEKYPASYNSPGKIVVGGLTNWSTLHNSSNFGQDTLDFLAPFEIKYNGEKRLETISGTSASAAVVSAFAALIASEYPDKSPIELVSHMKSSSRTIASLEDKVRDGRVFHPTAALYHPHPRAPEVIEELPDIKIVANQIYEINLNPLVIGFGNIEYSWLKDGFEISNSTSPSFQLPRNNRRGTYTLKITSNFGMTEQTFAVIPYDDSWFSNYMPYPVGKPIPRSTKSYGNGYFVAWDRAADSDKTDYILNSSDGINWSRQKISTDPDNSIFSENSILGFHGGYHWLLGETSTFQTTVLYFSTNGFNWEILDYFSQKNTSPHVTAPPYVLAMKDKLLIQEYSKHGYIFDLESLALVSEYEIDGYMPIIASEDFLWKISPKSDENGYSLFSSEDGLTWKSASLKLESILAYYYNPYNSEIWISDERANETQIVSINNNEATLKKTIPIHGSDMHFLQNLVMFDNSIHKIWNTETEELVEVPPEISPTNIYVDAISDEYLVILTRDNFYKWWPFEENLENIGIRIISNDYSQHYGLGQVFRITPRGIEHSFDSKNFRIAASADISHGTFSVGDYFLSAEEESSFIWSFDGLHWQRILKPEPSSQQLIPVLSGIIRKNQTGFSYLDTEGNWKPASGLPENNITPHHFNNAGGVFFYDYANHQIFLPGAADGSQWESHPTPFFGTEKSIEIDIFHNGIHLYPSENNFLPANAQHSMDGVNWQPTQWHGDPNRAREHRGLYYTNDRISADLQYWANKPSLFETIEYPWIFQESGRIYIGSNNLPQGWEENNLFGILWPTHQKWMYLPDWGWIHPGELNNGWAISYSADFGWLAFHPSIMPKAYSINEKRWLEPLEFHRN